MLTGRLSTHFDSIFTKNPVSTLLNTLAVRIFMSGNRQLTLENAARVYPDYKQKCEVLGSLPYKHPSNNYCCNLHMSGNEFLELLLFF